MIKTDNITTENLHADSIYTNTLSIYEEDIFEGAVTILSTQVTEDVSRNNLNPCQNRTIAKYLSDVDKESVLNRKISKVVSKFGGNIIFGKTLYKVNETTTELCGCRTFNTEIYSNDDIDILTMSSNKGIVSISSDTSSLICDVSHKSFISWNCNGVGHTSNKYMYSTNSGMWVGHGTSIPPLTARVKLHFINDDNPVYIANNSDSSETPCQLNDDDYAAHFDDGCSFNKIISFKDKNDKIFFLYVKIDNFIGTEPIFEERYAGHSSKNNINENKGQPYSIIINDGKIGPYSDTYQSGGYGPFYMTREVNGVVRDVRVEDGKLWFLADNSKITVCDEISIDKDGSFATLKRPSQFSYEKLKNGKLACLKVFKDKLIVLFGHEFNDDLNAQWCEYNGDINKTFTFYNCANLEGSMAWDRESDPLITFDNIAFIRGRNATFYSTDGIVWDKCKLTEDNINFLRIHKIYSDDNDYVYVAHGGPSDNDSCIYKTNLYVSDDGITWVRNKNIINNSLVDSITSTDKNVFVFGRDKKLYKLGLK